MLKITVAVQELLQSSDVALESMRAGLLNLSAFAEQIHNQVEEKTMKPVKKMTVVVALSRLAKKMEHVKPLKPEVVLDQVIVSQEQQHRVLDHFQQKPIAVFTDLVGITVRFSEKYLAEPNVVYAILSLLAAKRINLIEIVSTYTELTMIIKKEEMEKTIQALNKR